MTSNVSTYRSLIDTRPDDDEELPWESRCSMDAATVRRLARIENPTVYRGEKPDWTSIFSQFSSVIFVSRGSVLPCVIVEVTMSIANNRFHLNR